MDIYEALEKIIVVKPFWLQSSLFIDDVKNELETEKDIASWDILKKIASLGVEVTEKGVIFHPMFVQEDKRTFSVEDISEENFIILEELVLEKVPINLRARVADILWNYRKKYVYAKLAANSYFELFELWFSVDEWTGTLDMIRRAISISLQIKDENIFERACGCIYKHVKFLDGKDDGFLSLRLLEILIYHNYKELNDYIYIAKKIISLHKQDVAKVEQAYEILNECYIKLKNVNEAKNSMVALADYFVDYANTVMGTNIQGAMRAENYLQRAVLLYRNNGNALRAEETHRKLVSIQKEIPKLMVPFSTEIDVKDLYKTIDANIDNLTLEESIVRLTQMIVLYKKEDMKKKVVEEYRKFPLSHMFKKNIINASGQTVFSLPPLDIANIEANEQLLDYHINQKIVEESKLSGDLCVKYTLHRIREMHEIERDNIDFLVKENPIIPEGRERIFGSAIFMILCGQYYEAVHILAPQVENLFRNIAKEVGGLTVTLEDDGSSKEKVLSSIFDLPELVDCYDNDILYLFKALLNEQSGANIRNEVAHGIVNDASACSGVYLYFAVAVMKLLALTSRGYYGLIKNNPKLKNVIMPKDSAVRINP